MKKSKYNDLEDMLYRFQLTYDEIIDFSDVKYIPTTTTGFRLLPGIYEIIDTIFMLKSLLPEEVKVNITVDDVRLRSNITTNKTIDFAKKAFFYIILGFTQSRLGELVDIPRFIQLIPGSFKSDKPGNIIGTDKVHLKCDCIDGSIANCTRESIFYSFALSSPPGQKTYKEPKIKLFKKVNKSVLSHITFYLEDDDHKPVDFISETINFTCPLIKT